ncbi:taste receptor type 2 member 10-like [Lithobates pipiens]
MVSRSFIFTASADFVTLLISTPFNIFILNVIILDVAKSKKFHVSYQLICGITIFNILGQFPHICENILVLLEYGLFSVATASKLILAFDMATYLCISYFSAWLCMHFCLKIVNINKKFYIFLQKIFPRTFKWIFISTVVGSFSLSFVSFWSTSNGSTFNNTLSDDKPTLTMYGKHLFFVDISRITILLSFLILSFSALTVIISLFKHMKHLKKNAEGLRYPSVEAHVKAMKTIMFLLTINLIYFVAGLSYFFLKFRDIYQYVSCTSVAIYFLFSPIILIKGNSKLEKMFYKLFNAKSTQR